MRILFPELERPVQSFDLAERERLSAAAKRLHDDWWAAIYGDGATVRALVDRYGLDPTDSHVGPD